MTSRASSSVWWPGITADIEGVRRNCSSCDKVAPSQPAAPPRTLPSPDYPFQQICSDFLTYWGNSYLIIVDRFSSWLSVFKVPMSVQSSWSNASATNLRHLGPEPTSKLSRGSRWPRSSSETTPHWLLTKYIYTQNTESSEDDNTLISAMYLPGSFERARAKGYNVSAPTSQEMKKDKKEEKKSPGKKNEEKEAGEIAKRLSDFSKDHKHSEEES